MTDKKFWNIINKMEWSKDYSYNRISKEILNNKYGTKEELLKVYNILNNKYNKLLNQINKLTKEEYFKYINLSDDGLSDLIYNIIGHGQKSYMSVFNNKKNFLKFEDKESFLYSFFTLEK